MLLYVFMSLLMCLCILSILLVLPSEIYWWDIYNDSLKSITYESHFSGYFSKIIVSLDIAFSCWNNFKLFLVLLFTKISGFLPCRPSVSSSISHSLLSIGYKLTFLLPYQDSIPSLVWLWIWQKSLSSDWGFKPPTNLIIQIIKLP